MLGSGNLFLIARILLVVDALMYVSIGAGVMIYPDIMEGFGIALVTVTGTTTTRTWGALFAGMGMFGLTMATRRDRVLTGLLLLVMASALVLLARAYGMWVDGLESRQWTELRRESIGFSIALLGCGAVAVSRRRNSSRT